MAKPVDRAGHIEAAWRRERPDLDPSSVGIVTRIWHLAKIFGDERRRLLTQLGIEPALLDLLGTLRREGEPYSLSTRQLAERTLVTPAAISQRLSRAEHHGWITREPGPDRSTIVRLTAAGRQRVDEIAGRIFEHENGLLDSLGPAERRRLARQLEQLVLAVAPPGAIDPVGAELSG
jgi:DNA-binding MarR family transcriptional regulator